MRQIKRVRGKGWYNCYSAILYLRHSYENKLLNWTGVERLIKIAIWRHSTGTESSYSRYSGLLLRVKGKYFCHSQIFKEIKLDKDDISEGFTFYSLYVTKIVRKCCNSTLISSGSSSTSCSLATGAAPRTRFWGQIFPILPSDGCQCQPLWGEQVGWLSWGWWDPLDEDGALLHAGRRLCDSL